MVRLVQLRHGLSAFADAQAPPRAGREQVHLVRLDVERDGVSAFADGPPREVKRGLVNEGRMPAVAEAMSDWTVYRIAGQTLKELGAER